MKALASSLALCVLFSTSGANAALESRLGGLAVYDTDLNITWLADANANGPMTWSQAKAWAASIDVGGFGGWRLPTTLQPDATCTGISSGVPDGYSCTGSEMGHLYYSELGGLTGQTIDTTHNANYSLFQNIRLNAYWSNTEYVPNFIEPNTDSAWAFLFNGGGQYGLLKFYDLYALAVRDGDVAAVPVPAAAWLLGSGLLGVIGVARRKAA